MGIIDKITYETIYNNLSIIIDVTYICIVFNNIYLILLNVLTPKVVLLSIIT